MNENLTTQKMPNSAISDPEKLVLNEPESEFHSSQKNGGTGDKQKFIKTLAKKIFKLKDLQKKKKGTKVVSNHPFVLMQKNHKKNRQDESLSVLKELRAHINVTPPSPQSDSKPQFPGIELKLVKSNSV